MKADYLLIDGNSLGFAAQSMKKLHSGGDQTQAIFGSLRSVRLLCDENKQSEPIVFWDGKSWRYDYFADYKGTREKDPKASEEREAYRKQRPIIARMLSKLGVRQVIASNMEADDMIALYSIAYAKKGKFCTVVSGDKDLLQLVDRRVDWYNPIRKQGGKRSSLLRVTHETFAEDIGYEDPVSFVKGKALLGDPSDNIKGIDGIGAKAAPLVVKTWPNLKEMIDDIRLRGDAAIPAHLSRYRQKLKNFAASDELQQRFARNYRLMRLSPRYLPAPVNRRDMSTPINIAAFEQECKELGFISILRDVDAWVQPFAERCAEAA